MSGASLRLCIKAFSTTHWRSGWSGGSDVDRTSKSTSLRQLIDTRQLRLVASVIKSKADVGLRPGKPFRGANSDF